MPGNRNTAVQKDVSSSETQAVIESTSEGGVGAQLQVAINHATSSNVSSRRNNIEQVNHEEISKFKQAFNACIEKFSKLNISIEKVMESVEEILDLPKLWESYKKLSPLMKAVVFVAIVALMALMKWMTYELIQFAWPYIMSFLESEEGKKVLNTAGDTLTSINNSGVFSVFETAFANKAEESTVAISTNAEGESDDETEIDTVVPMSLLHQFLEAPAAINAFVTIIYSLFRHITKNLSANENN